MANLHLVKTTMMTITKTAVMMMATMVALTKMLRTAHDHRQSFVHPPNVCHHDRSNLACRHGSHTQCDHSGIWRAANTSIASH
jgi:hypothetical protein